MSKELKILFYFIVVGTLIAGSSYPFFAVMNANPITPKCYLCRQSLSFGVNAYTYLSLCAGISLLSYSLIGTLNNAGNYLMRALCIYFILLLVMFGLDEIVDFLLCTKWVYIPTGGLVICLVLSAIWHLGKLQHLT